MMSFTRIAILFLILATVTFSTCATPQTDLATDQFIDRLVGNIGLTDNRAASSSTGQDTIPALPEKVHFPSIEQAQNDKECHFEVDSDDGGPDGISSASVQAAWLRDGLAVSTEAWNVVLLHHAPYSSFRHGPTQRLQWPLREWGAHVVMAGHDHSYERLLIDGVLYFVNGLGGANRYQLGEPVPGSQVRYNLDFGAMLVEAGEQGMAFRFISIAGEIIDSVVLLR